MAAFAPDLTNEQLADYCRRNQIGYLALFGSAVRGELRPDSDVDLLVEFTPEARIGFMALGRIGRELSALFGRPVDLVPRAGLKPLIRQEVLQSAQVIYPESTGLDDKGPG
jgi:predicted nucleotidyltransferase